MYMGYMACHCTYLHLALKKTDITFMSALTIELALEVD